MGLKGPLKGAIQADSLSEGLLRGLSHGVQTAPAFVETVEQLAPWTFRQSFSSPVSRIAK